MLRALGKFKGLLSVVILQSLVILFLFFIVWSQSQMRVLQGSEAEDELSLYCDDMMLDANCSTLNYTAVNFTDLLGGTRRDRTLMVNGSERIHFSVKTASVYHHDRLPPVILTWLQTIKSRQVNIITDSKNDYVTKTALRLGIRVIETNCQMGHEDDALCCKSGMEFEQYYKALDRGEDYDWFCHFDDDAYVNVPNLVKLLKKYPHNENIYIGHYRRKWGPKPVTKEFLSNFPSQGRRHRRFYYALGPAYCISKELMTKLPPFFSGAENFTSTCVKTGFPDDAAVGVVIEVVLKFPMVEVSQMLNHLDEQKRLQPHMLGDVVTMGYHGENIICIPNSTFPFCADPTRFLSYHCLNYPSISWCQT